MCMYIYIYIMYYYINKYIKYVHEITFALNMHYLNISGPWFPCPTVSCRLWYTLTMVLLNFISISFVTFDNFPLQYFTSNLVIERFKIHMFCDFYNESIFHLFFDNF